ncbi:hypothetical protein PIB30_072170 [Stylosanthes scabra]|uniref:Uncharacterized protein n=1 Tax=Stylosanthes scabra TaxID=79078 RepID=A0ABU6XP91_9FABA|nr:hypothetical protein [Stylosanthes scabra]
MGRKTTVEKEKKKQIDVQYDKCHRASYSPSEHAKTYIGFSNQKKALVHEMGFGALAENVSNYNFSNLIMMELACFGTECNERFISTALDTEENITKFKRAFILYVQKAMLCPNNSKPLSPKTLPTILDVTNPRAMNWGRHVYSFLLNGITEMKKKNLKSVDDCVFVLLKSISKRHILGWILNKSMLNLHDWSTGKTAR